MKCKGSVLVVVEIKYGLVVHLIAKAPTDISWFGKKAIMKSWNHQ